MAAALGALLALLAPCVTPLQVTVPDPRTVALLFQPVLLRCQFQVGTPGPPPIVTWKYKSFCPSPTSGDTWGGPESAAGGGDTLGTCPDSARTVRIVATKQGDVVTLGDFYRGRAVTIRGGAELSLGPAAWGDSGFYICTVTSTQDLQGNNEAVAELVVLRSLPEGTRLLPEGTLPDWLFVALVALGGVLVALGVGLCWCQCCPHTCCCYLRCPCCPQTCCCPEALYLAGKAATSGGTFSPAPPTLALQLLGSSQSSQVPLLRDSDGSVVSGPSVPPPTVLRYLEQNLATWDPAGQPPHWRAGPPSGPAPSDISSLHEAPWTPPRHPRSSPQSPSTPPRRHWSPPRSPSTPPRRPRSPPRGPSSPSRGRWHSAEVLGGSEFGEGSPPPARHPPRSRSRDDLLGGSQSPPRNPPGPPRRLRKNDALSRESLVV